MEIKDEHWLYPFRQYITAIDVIKETGEVIVVIDLLKSQLNIEFDPENMKRLGIKHLAFETPVEHIKTFDLTSPEMRHTGQLLIRITLLSSHSPIKQLQAADLYPYQVNINHVKLINENSAIK